jgi:DnaJ-class molecular chaperone
MLSRLFPGLFRKSHYEMKDQHGGHVCPDCRGSGKNQQGEVCGRCHGHGEIGQRDE